MSREERRARRIQVIANAGQDKESNSDGARKRPLAPVNAESLRLATDENKKLTKMVESLTEQIANLKKSSTEYNEVSEAIDLIKKGRLEFLDPESIEISDWADREKDFIDSTEFYQLVENIQLTGNVDIPITVRVHNSGHQLVAGNRRLAACRFLKIPIPAVIKEMDDKQFFQTQFNENNFRVGISPFAQAASFKRRLDSGDIKNQAELARIIGKDRSIVTLYLRLLDIPEEIRTTVFSETKINPFTINGEEIDTQSTTWAPYKTMAAYAKIIATLDKEAKVDLILRVTDKKDEFDTLPLKDKLGLFESIFNYRPTTTPKPKGESKPVWGISNKGKKYGELLISPTGDIKVTINKKLVNDGLIKEFEAFLKSKINKEIL